MAKSKKEDTGELQVSIEQFTRTRDSVIMSLTNLQAGLTHVQNGLTDLLRAYMQHTASILAGDSGAVAETLQLPPHISTSVNAIAEAAAQATKGAPVAVVAEGGKRKRKREKKERDPNAPKKPLTAAFLYAQVARPIVRKDLESSLGPNEKLEPNAVNLEVTKRWNEMPEEDKEKWKASYRDSMEKFKEEMKTYTAQTNADAAALHDEEEASDEAEVGALDSDASEDSDGEAAAVVSAPFLNAPTPPTANTKTPRANKRQKTATQTNGTLAPVPIAPAISGHSPVPLPIVSKLMPQILPAGSNGIDTSTPAKGKDKKTQKKDKPTPQPIAPALSSQTKEPSPDDPKKKSKSRSTRNAEAETPSEPVVEKEATKTKKRDRSKRKSEGVAA
ncbi:uncharacterized protein BDR25DRAFT_90932 [Lindgomyces ingoldianus]|uniref:Uncharacterized protein n=1 Tax=Lindgomyces ingoldianus TaxID=673940 RepID=A0ACB6RAD4_9PLEO|nr:uncharacterized protein BDR25DRAFT_90932 [Lindgomyces ingoldianus]KAF2476146.1 hypothetical protein BDR25DRAFT_90932 [Lindgomyces ingoldianus]